MSLKTTNAVDEPWLVSQFRELGVKPNVAWKKEPAEGWPFGDDSDDTPEEALVRMGFTVFMRRSRDSEVAVGVRHIATGLEWLAVGDLGYGPWAINLSEKKLPLGYDFGCKQCGRPTTYKESVSVQPPKDMTDVAYILVCWACAMDSEAVPVKHCDSCGEYQPASGGYSGQVRISMEGDTEEVFWQCQKCCGAGTGLVNVLTVRA